MNVWWVTSNVHCSSCSVVGQLAVQEEVRDLEIRRVLGELLDRVAAVAEDAGVTVEVGDRRLARGGRQVRRVVAVQRRVELAKRRGREHPAFDRDGDGLSRAVVGDGDGVGHVASSRGTNWLVVSVGCILTRAGCSTFSAGGCAVPPIERRCSCCVQPVEVISERTVAVLSAAECSRLSSSTSSAAAIRGGCRPGRSPRRRSPRSAATYGFSSRSA